MTQGDTKTSVTKAKWPKGRIRVAVLSALATALLYAVAVALAVLCVLRFAPAHVLRCAALPVLRATLDYPRIELGSIRLRLGRRGQLELRDLHVGAPRGFAQAPLHIGRLLLRYDLRDIGAGRLRVDELRIERPVVRVETRDGLLNWVAVLQQLSSGEHAPTKPEPPVEPQAGLSLEVTVGQVAVTDLSVAFSDDRDQRAVLDAVQVSAQGRYSGAKSHGRLTVRVAPRPGRRASIALRVANPRALQVLLASALALDLRLQQLAPLRASVDLRADLASKSIASTGGTGVPNRLQRASQLPPTRLALRALAAVDQTKGTANLRELTLRFNDYEIVRAQAQASSLNARPTAKLNVQHLLLPLDALVPYAALFAPQLRFGGAIEATDLQMTAPVDTLGVALPTMAGGQLELRDLWAKSPVAQAIDGAHLPVFALEGVNATVHAVASAEHSAVHRNGSQLLKQLPRASAAMSELREPGVPIVVTSRARIKGLRLPEAVVTNLALDAVAGIDVQGLVPRAFGLAAQLGVAHWSYSSPEIGIMSGSLRTSLRVHGDLGQQAYAIEQLRLKLDDVLTARLHGSVGAGQTPLAFRASFELDPVPLGALLRRLPPRVRASLPISWAGGRVALRSTVEGRVPRPDTPPLDLPLEIDSDLRLDRVGFDQRGVSPNDATVAPVLRVRGLDGHIAVRGRPADMRVAARLTAASIAKKPELGLEVTQLALPLDLRWTRNAVSADIGVTIGRLRQQLPGLSLRERDIAVKAALRVRVPLSRMLAGRSAQLDQARATGSASIGAIDLVQGAGHMVAEDLHVTLGLEHGPRDAGAARWTIGGRIASLEDRLQGLIARRTSWSLKGQLAGLDLSVPRPTVSLASLSADVAGALQVEGLRDRQALDRELRGTRAELAVVLHPGGPVQLERLALRLPTLGARLDLDGKLYDPLHLLLSPTSASTIPSARSTQHGESLPAFDARLRVALDNPPASSRPSARLLLPGLLSSGKLGLVLNARSAGGDRLALRGRLVAHRFSLWHQGEEHRIGSKGAKARVHRTSMTLRNLNADVPISQDVRVALSPPRVQPVVPKQTVFASAAAGAAYRLVRPFAARRANLTIDGITLRDQLLARVGSAREAVVSTSELQIGTTVLDLAIRDSTVELSQLAIKLFGGDVLGSLQLQIPRLEPFDVRLRADVQLTDVDLAYLDTAARRRGETTRVSALAKLDYELASQEASGRVLLTDLSLDTLDRLLVYLDPHKLDESIQANRRLINSWYTRMARPEVQKVSVWVDHSQLNLDIRLGALWPFGPILRKALSNVRIRRVSIKPFLPGGSKAAEPTDLISARGAPGDWRRP